MDLNIDPRESPLDTQIVLALERIFEAFRALLWQESKEHNLTPIQVQLLIFIGMHPGEYCKITYLAREFNMTKPTVSDAVKALEAKGYLTKRSDDADGRSRYLALTPQGEAIAQKLQLFTHTLKTPVNRLPPEEKIALWNSLLTILRSLQRAGIISLQRMCFNCLHYRQVDGGHYCALLQQQLGIEAVRVDCEEHAAIPVQ